MSDSSRYRVEPNAYSMTEEVQDRVIDYLRKGHFVSAACGYAGINTRTYKDWMQKGKDHQEEGLDSQYSRFVVRAEEAMAESQNRALQRIHQGMEDDWKAAAWFLERRHSSNWGKRESLRISNDDDSGFKVALLTPDERAALLRQLSLGRGVQGPTDDFFNSQQASSIDNE